MKSSEQILDNESAPGRKGLRTILTWAKRLFGPLGFAFIAYFMWRSRDLIQALIVQAQLLNILVAILLWSALQLLISPACGARMLHGLGASLGFFRSFSIHTANLPARYLPGGIWHTVGRVGDLVRQGVKADQLTSFVLLENMMAAGVSLALGGGAMLRAHRDDHVTMPALLATIAGGALLIAAPCLLNLARIRKLAPIRIRDYFVCVSWTMAFWCIAGLSFATYLSAFPTLGSTATMLDAAGSYIFSWAIGFIAIFSPQGIGVSEATMASVLPGAPQFEGTIAMAAGFRLITLLADMLSWIVSLPLRQPKPA